MKSVNQFRWTILLLVVAIAPTLTLAQEAKPSPGQETYKTKCALCHGADGAAKTALGLQMKASDFHSVQVQKKTDAELKDVITKGRDSMPPFGEQLSSDEITQVLSYVRQLGKKSKAVAHPAH